MHGPGTRARRAGKSRGRSHLKDIQPPGAAAWPAVTCGETFRRDSSPPAPACAPSGIRGSGRVPGPSAASNAVRDGSDPIRGPGPSVGARTSESVPAGGAAFYRSDGPRRLEAAPRIGFSLQQPAGGRTGTGSPAVRRLHIAADMTER